MHTDQLKIIGCGGHSKVVIDVLALSTHSFKISLCDSNEKLLGKEIGGLIIDSTMESLSSFTGFAHIAIGNNQARLAISKLLNLQTVLFSVIHPSAIVSKSAHIEQGSFIAALVILGPESSIGEGCIINHGAIIDHEVCIGTYSHIAPNSTLGGGVKVGNGVLVGAGAVILPGVTIGDGATIAAGAVVLRDVKEYTIVKGVPAV